MKSENSVRESVRRFSEEDLKFLYSRFSQNLSGDRADIMNFLAKVNDLDRWLRTATSAEDFFDMLDVVGEAVRAEYNRRWKRED